jgi:hypothetical protein
MNYLRKIVHCYSPIFAGLGVPSASLRACFAGDIPSFTCGSAALETQGGEGEG